MRKIGWTMALALVLVLSGMIGGTARAQNQNNNQGQGQNRDRNQQNQGPSGEKQTIRGVIAGVTLEGEMAIDYRTRRAVEADTAYLTVVGSPRRERGDSGNRQNQDRDRDQNRDQARNQDQGQQAGGSGRHRQNIYVIWLSPRTKVRDRTNRDDQNKEATIDALEVGDRVEIEYTARENSNASNANQNQANQANANQKQGQAQKHGRHRIYFGDANTISILAEPRPQERGANVQGDRSSNSNQNRDRDRDSDKDRSQKSDPK